MMWPRKKKSTYSRFIYPTTLTNSSIRAVSIFVHPRACLNKPNFLAWGCTLILTPHHLPRVHLSCCTYLVCLVSYDLSLLDSESPFLSVLCMHPSQLALDVSHTMLLSYLFVPQECRIDRFKMIIWINHLVQQLGSLFIDFIPTFILAHHLFSIIRTWLLLIIIIIYFGLLLFRIDILILSLCHDIFFSCHHI